MQQDKLSTWMVGEIENGGDPVLVRHRLAQACEVDPTHEWLVIVTHQLAKVQANGLPEEMYNNGLQTLDAAIIAAMQPESGDQVALVETCHGRRTYYGYVRDVEVMGNRIQILIDENGGQNFSYRTGHDPRREFAKKYLALIKRV